MARREGVAPGVEVQVQWLHGSGGFGDSAVSRTSATLRVSGPLLGKDGQEWGSRACGGPRELRKRRMRHWHRQASGKGMGTGDWA